MAITRAHPKGEIDLALAPPGAQDPAVDELLVEARTIDGFGLDPDRTLPWVIRAGTIAPLPGARTAELWRLLAETARIDVAAARMLEPHLDALAILAEARRDGIPLGPQAAAADGGWGVFAAEGGDDPVRAEQGRGGIWRLRGTKPWCSLAGRLDRALLTAWAGEERRLFAIDLHDARVTARSGPWVPRGMTQVVSAPIELDRAPALPVGDAGWYLRRAGFAWGGMGVAAVWWGGAEPLADALRVRAARDDTDQLAQVYAGQADAANWSSSLALAEAARAVDDGTAGEPARLLAARVRAVVAANARSVLALEARALGPGPVSADERHARRVADLELYLRQDHADRDLARLGRLSAAGLARVGPAHETARPRVEAARGVGRPGEETAREAGPVHRATASAHPGSATASAHEAAPPRSAAASADEAAASPHAATASPHDTASAHDAASARAITRGHTVAASAATTPGPAAATASPRATTAITQSAGLPSAASASGSAAAAAAAAPSAAAAAAAAPSAAAAAAAAARIVPSAAPSAPARAAPAARTIPSARAAAASTRTAGSAREEEAG